MTHLQEKTTERPRNRSGWWQGILAFFGVFSPILPGFINIAQAAVVELAFESLLNPIIELWFQFASYLTTWSGWLLDLSVEYFVLNMAEQVNGIGAIDGLWQTFRDLGNIAFIGVLLYIAILTVLGMGNQYNTKRMLVRLVIVALFVNFSLFATKVVIDTSNVAALQFYNAVQVEDCGQDTECDLSHFFVDALNLSSVNSPAALENGVASQSRIFIARMMGTWFLLTATFVMGAMAFLLIIRFVVLVLLMIASPLAFIAFALPGASNWGMDWVNKLLEQSFFAPAMLAMVYITARLANDLQGAIGSGETDLVAAIVSNDSDAFSVILVYIILIGLMVSTLLVAKKLGAHGATKSIEWGKKLRNWGTVTVAGGTARTTIGLAGEAADSKFKKTRFAQSYFGSKFRDSTTKKVAEAKFGTKKSGAEIMKERKEAKSKVASYDARQSAREEIEQATDDATRRRALNRLSSKEKIDLGKKFLEEHAELLSENDFKAIDNHDGFSERDKQEIKEAAVDTLEAIRDQNRQTPSIGDIKAFLATRSDDQLKSIDIELINQPQVIQSMSGDQFEKALKGRSQIEQLLMKRERLDELEQAILNGDVQNLFAGKSDEDIAKLLKLASDSTISDINSNPNVNNVRADLRVNDLVIDELGISIGAKLAEEGMKRGEKDALFAAAKTRRNRQGRNATDKNKNFVDWGENGQGKAIYS